MTRRTTLTAVSALALIAIPSAAFAYEAPGIDVTVTDPTPGVGDAITVSIAGAQAGGDVTLTVTSNPASIPNDAITIAGTKSLTKAASQNGVAVFTVAFSESGTYTAVATDAANSMLGDATLVVGGGASAAVETQNVDGGPLAVTGFDGTQLLLGAGALLATGAGAVVVARRRQST